MLLTVENVGIETICAAVSKNLVPVEERLKNFVDAKKLRGSKKVPALKVSAWLMKKFARRIFARRRLKKFSTKLKLNAQIFAQ